MLDLEELRRKFDESPYSRFLGMRIVELSRGYAKVSMTTRPEFLTWDGLVQGGVISSLLDQAFGYSTNSLENVHVAVQLNVNFMSSPTPGDTLTAEAKVLHAGRTTGVSEMTVTDSKGKVIARATGTTVSKGVRGG